MIKTFFSAIPHCLFEPIAIGALLGLLLAFWLYYTRRDRMFWIISSSIMFMILWRVVQEIVSKRYASILIYPAVISVSYLCFRLKKLSIIAKIPVRFQNFLSWGLLLIMVFVCIGKDFRFNLNEGYLRECANIAKRDSAQFQYPLALTYDKEIKRIGYYTGLPTLFYGKDKGFDWNSDEISDLLKRYRYFGDAIYLFIDEKKQTLPITAESLGHSDQEWVMLATHFQDNRRKKRLTLYRYLPGPIPWKIATSKDVEQFQRESKQSILFNGNFDKPEENKYLQSFFKTLKSPLPSFYSHPSWKFPAGWRFESRVSNINAVEAELRVYEITGEQALRLSGRSRFIVFTNKMLPKGEYDLIFLVHGRPETHFGISLYTYDNAGKFVAYREAAHFRLPSEEKYLYHFKINDQEIGAGTKFRLNLVLYDGEVFWEGVSLIPTSKSEIQTSVSEN